MQIGFDISQIGADKAGCGYFAFALANGLANNPGNNQFTYYPTFGDFYFDRLMPLENPFKKQGIKYGPRHLTRESAGEFWRAPNLEEKLGEPEVIHANNFWCPANIGKARLIYTLYDLGFAIEPGWTTEANRIGCLDGVFQAALSADWILAISEASKRSYLEFFPRFPEERIRVIYPSSRFSESARRGKRPKAIGEMAARRFWMSVGTIEPRKNHRLLVEAYRAYATAVADPMPLVLAGGKGWLMDDFIAEATDERLPGRIIFTGYVSDDELIWLYRNCYANLYPSLFEGFGLPVLEGMQFGAATISSNSSSLPEVGGDAAIMLAPESAGAWTAEMLRLAADPAERDRLKEAATERAKAFNSQRSVAQLLDFYDEVAGSPKRRDLSA